MYSPPHIKSKVMMKLENNVLYWSELRDVKVDTLTQEQILKFFGNGRISGVGLETVIANKFDDCVEAETQGAGPDIYRDVNDKIQAKTYKPLKDGVFDRGVRKGMERWDGKDIFTTKSGIWDTKLSDAERAREIEEYWGGYDTFMYIDITNTGKDFSYSFISVPTESVKATHEDGHISYNDIRFWIKDEKWDV